MSVIFTPENHKYSSIEPDGIDWISATTLISFFKAPFDAATQSQKSSKNRKSKWFGLDPKVIQQIWKDEALRATTLGTWYHDQREKELCMWNTIGYKGHELPIIKPFVDEKGVKYAQSQQLTDGVYPEILLYLKSVGIAGQSDRTYVYNKTVDIKDYKTNKELKEKGYTNWEGITQKMKAPVNHLDDCHLMHYAIQLSLYMFIILRQNPELRPGELELNHILFEEAGRDQYDNPITKLDQDGNPVVKDIKNYQLPYLKKEVIDLLYYVKNNRQAILKAKK